MGSVSPPSFFSFLVMLQRAKAIAAAAHAGQVDKANQPYFGHLMRVMEAAPEGDAKVVAILHDLIEDCPGWDLNRLGQEGFEPRVIEAIDAMTKKPGQDYGDYLAGVKANDLARVVKLADLADNMRLDRIPNPGPKDFQRLAKYEAAREFLEN